MNIDLKKNGLKLGTKAETLDCLQNKLTKAKILPLMYFTFKDWRIKREDIINKYLNFSENEKIAVIVRSSSLNEDTANASMAGKYESILNVCSKNQFENAVEQVFASYDDNSQDNQILIQRMLTDVAVCGVAFTLEPSTGGNYYVVNYDKTGSTDSITSGAGKSNFLYYCFKTTTDGEIAEEMRTLIFTLRELEKIFGQYNLDVEFAIDCTGKLYIFQVRTLCMCEEQLDFKEQETDLKRIKSKIIREQKKKPYLCGDKAIYSVMTDWNPAEMIGVKPKSLAMSLYREIITDSVWAYQRDNYGYRNLRSFPLMVDFCGLPYIDVRVSFNSFIPAELDEEISEKLVNYYLDRLIENPSKHDKAEFDIIFSCYTMDLLERIQILKDYGFTDDEIEQIVAALRNVTNRISDHKTGIWRKDYEKIYILEKHYDEILNSDLDEIEKIYWLLEDCKRYGTLPFAGLARAGFIAVQILQSLVNCSILSKRDYESFMEGVSTISSEMKNDFSNMSKSAFLKKYGHLRPGTYDITSLRYDEASDIYFNWGEVHQEKCERQRNVFKLSIQQLNTLKEKLAENGLTNDILEFFDFIRIAIEGREYGKFVFTKSLSKALELIGLVGEKYGFSREDCAYMDIQTVKKLYATTLDVKNEFEETIENGKRKHMQTKAITLPPFIAKGEDVFSFYYPNSEPNYITSERVNGELVLLKDTSQISELEGKIVLISSADPGYDWIFSHNIKGLVTMYGGANSHMAIRAGELKIPSAIGVGQKMFENIKKYDRIEIDALGKTIKKLR